MSSAGKDLQSGVTEGDPKALAAGVLGTALVGAENVPGGKAAGKIGKSIDELMINYPELKKQWWLDEADETGYVTLYHGADANELNSILKTGLHPDSEGFAYTSPDAPTATAYSVMAGGEKKFKDRGKDAQKVSAENRITIELKVPIEEVRKNFDNQRSKRSKETLLGVTGKEQLVTSESLDKAKKKFLDSPFDRERGPIKVDTQNNLKFKTPFYELSEFRFKGGLPPEYITGISQKPKVQRLAVKKKKGGSVIERNPYNYTTRTI